MSNNEDDYSDVVKSLSEREKKVLKEFLGVEDLSIVSLEEIGKQFDVTRERIRAIEEKALKRLNADTDPDNDGPEAA